jgi:FkbM family methyltransferase
MLDSLIPLNPGSRIGNNRLFNLQVNKIFWSKFKMKNIMKQWITQICLKYLHMAIAPWSRWLPGQRTYLMNKLQIDGVIDIGANVGDFSKEIRKFGYKGHIYLVEPLSAPFEILSRRFLRDKFTSSFNGIINSECGWQEIYHWGDSTTASVLKLHENRGKHHNYLVENGRQLSQSKSIDCLIFSDLILSSKKRLFIKLDVQGAENLILSNLQKVASRVSLIQVETGIQKIYKDGSHISETIQLLEKNNFTIVSIVTERFNSAWSAAVDVDLLAVRNDILEMLPRK